MVRINCHGLNWPAISRSPGQAVVAKMRRGHAYGHRTIPLHCDRWITRSDGMALRRSCRLGHKIELRIPKCQDEQVHYSKIIIIQPREKHCDAISRIQLRSPSCLPVIVANLLHRLLWAGVVSVRNIDRPLSALETADANDSQIEAIQFSTKAGRRWRGARQALRPKWLGISDCRYTRASVLDIIPGQSSAIQARAAQDE
jgi:hypothetical protein